MYLPNWLRENVGEWRGRKENRCFKFCVLVWPCTLMRMWYSIPLPVPLPEGWISLFEAPGNFCCGDRLWSTSQNSFSNLVVCSSGCLYCFCLHRKIRFWSEYIWKSHFLTRNYVSVPRGICNMSTQLKAKNTFYKIRHFDISQRCYLKVGLRSGWTSMENTCYMVMLPLET